MKHKIKSFPVVGAVTALVLSSGISSIGVKPLEAQTIPQDDLGSILHDIGTGSLSTAQAMVGSPIGSSALAYVSNNVERRRFVGTLNNLTPQDRLAILSDDGSTVTIAGSNGTNVTPIAKAGVGQGFEVTTVEELAFVPVAGVTYTVTVEYSNTFHTSPADLDGIKLFRYRLASPANPNFSPELTYDGIKTNGARLVWKKIPNDLAALPGFVFTGYDIYQTLDGNPNITQPPTFHITDRNISEQLLTGLTANTRYYYRLVVRYSVGTPAVAKAPVADTTFKTAGITYTVAFSGDKRACAGGHYLEGGVDKRREDTAHTADVSISITNKDTSDPPKTVATANTLFRLKLANNASSEGAQLIVTQNGTTTYTDPVEITTDANGQFAFKVLSSRLVGSATVIVQERVEKLPAETPKVYEWEDVASQNVEFAKPESKRLFGIKDFNQDYNSDTGWEFSPSSFTAPAPAATPQILTCRLYLRFRKDTNEAIVEKAYFIKNGTKYLTLDGNNDGTVSDTEYEARDANGTLEAPLWNSTEAIPRQLWLPVNGHKLRVRITGVGTTNDDMMVPAVPKSSKVIAFCNAAGQYAVVGANDNVTYQAARPALPEYLPIETKTLTINGQSVQGVAEFSVRAGYLIHRVNEIKFSVEDITTK